MPYQELDDAYTILRDSSKDHFLLLEIWADNVAVIDTDDPGYRTVENPSQFYQTSGGGNMLGHSFGDAPHVDNGYIAISNGTVQGLATQAALINNLILGSSIGPAFGGVIEKSLGTIQVSYVNNIVNRDLEGKRFVLSVGYWGEDYSNYKVLAQGKTLGVKLVGDDIEISFSLIPEGTQKLYPTETYDSGYSKGQAKRYIHGPVNKIKPAHQADGLWHFFNGTPYTIDPIRPTPPIGTIEFDGDFYFGDISYYVESGSTTDYEIATNQLPLDVSAVDGSVTTQSDHILITPPDFIDSGDQAYVFVKIPDTDTNLTYYAEYDCVITQDSDPDTLPVNIAGGVLTISKNRRTYRSRSITSITESAAALFQPVHNSGPTDVVKVELYSIKIVFNRVATKFQFYNPADGGNAKITTWRVPDVSAVADIPDGVALYDSKGYARVNAQNLSFVMDANGSAATIKSIAACQEISTSVNGSLSPVAASFTGEEIGVYYDAQKSMLHWLRRILHPLDCFIHFERASNDLRILRRFNYLSHDFDGNVNDLLAWSFDEALNEIVTSSIATKGKEPSISNLIVRYQLNHSSPEDSKSDSFPNVGSADPSELVIDGPLRLAADAAQMSSLSGREGARKSRSGFMVHGIGKDLILSTAGKARHRRIRYGTGELRAITQHFETEETYIEAVIYV